MITEPSDWEATCDNCDRSITGYYGESEEEFLDLLEGQDWIVEDDKCFCCEECRKKYYHEDEEEEENE